MTGFVVQGHTHTHTFKYIFLSKYISKGAVDMKFSPDVGNNPSNTYKENNTNKFRN